MQNQVHTQAKQRPKTIKKFVKFSNNQINGKYRIDFLEEIH